MVIVHPPMTPEVSAAQKRLADKQAAVAQVEQEIQEFLMGVLEAALESAGWRSWREGKDAEPVARRALHDAFRQRRKDDPLTLLVMRLMWMRSAHERASDEFVAALRAAAAAPANDTNANGRA